MFKQLLHGLPWNENGPQEMKLNSFLDPHPDISFSATMRIIFDSKVKKKGFKEKKKIIKAVRS